MRIAVDTRFLQASETHLYINFAKEVFLQLAKQHAEHEFIFLFDDPIDPSLDLPGNVTPVIITPKPTNTVLSRLWYDVKVSATLKQFKADIFVGTYAACGLTGTVPKILIVQTTVLQSIPHFSARVDTLFYKMFTRFFLKEAQAVISLSPSVKDEIVKKYKIPAEKIAVVETAPRSIYKRLEWQEREIVKEKYAHGCEYFIFIIGFGSEDKLMNLLKAFSNFKKWQKTNMKLVIAGSIPNGFKVQQKLDTYRYRNEMNITGNLSITETAGLTAAAYALIFNSLNAGASQILLEALQSEVPIIAPDINSVREVTGSAALYANKAEPEEIAAQMKLIFKDEQLRSKLIEQGKQQANQFTWDKTIAGVWDTIELTVSK